MISLVVNTQVIAATPAHKYERQKETACLDLDEYLCTATLPISWACLKMI